MKSEDENMELEQEAPNLAKVNKANPFITPKGYFNRLPEEIINQIALSEILPFENNFNIPENYFQNLSGQIQSSIYLNSISENDQDFAIPAGYFDTLQSKIEGKTIAVKKSKNVKLHFIRYAAAACVLLTTSLGIYFDIQRNTSVDYQLSKISSTEIESYLNQHTDGSDLPMIIENIDENTNLTIEDFTLETTN